MHSSPWGGPGGPEAKDGDRVLVGHVLVAPGGDRHLEVHRLGGEYRIALRRGAPVSGHVPSVDVFFSSIARNAGSNGVGCILTGMGADGAAGLLEMRRAGGRTFAQDRDTCAVWGMPAAAVDAGAAERCIPLPDVPLTLVAASRVRGPSAGAPNPVAASARATSARPPASDPSAHEAGPDTISTSWRSPPRS